MQSNRLHWGCHWDLCRFRVIAPVIAPPRRWPSLLAAGLFAVGTLAQPAAGAEGSWADELWEAVSQGKPALVLRPRIEVAELDGLERSEAYTIRALLGYGTKPFHGVSIYGDFETVGVIAPSQYRAPNHPPTGQTVIADPSTTELNQLYLKVVQPDWLGMTFHGGRQRIILDDARWVGNVGWRQNEQTYDGARLQLSFGLDALVAEYSFIGEVRRIFGNRGNAATRNFDSRSHLFNVHYDLQSDLRVTGFIYLMDLRVPEAGNTGTRSNATFGFRVTDTWKCSKDWSLSTQGSYAYQTDYAESPEFDAHYAMLDLKAGYAPVGALGIGYEYLGSDDGMRQIQTPLATAHKFNGWADVFLDNGGPMGLQDLYVYLQPKLPWKLKAKLVYHRFWDAQVGNSHGGEFDGALSRPLYKDKITGLFKFAHFSQSSGALRPDIYRVWFQVELKI